MVRAARDNWIIRKDVAISKIALYSFYTYIDGPLDLKQQALLPLPREEKLSYYF